VGNAKFVLRGKKVHEDLKTQQGLGVFGSVCEQDVFGGPDQGGLVAIQKEIGTP
jgi:hypothetical protein